MSEIDLATGSTASLAAQVLTDGYAILPDVLAPREIAHTRRALAPLLDAAGFASNSFLGRRTRRVYSLLAKTRQLDDMVLHPVILGMAEEILGPLQLSVATAIEIHPTESGQTLHADDGVYPFSASTGGPLTLSTMWAMDDFTAANGATRLVPGSHRWSEKRLSADVSTDEQAAEMGAGSVLVYLGSLLHGGGANRTDSPRLGVVIEFAVGWVRPQENLGLTYPPDLVRGLPERLQALLGYDLYPPFLGYVDGRHPRHLLDQGSEVTKD